MLRFLTSLLVLSGFLATPASAQQETLKSLTVLADHSMSVPLNLLARDYALNHHISITTTFSSTKTQITEIEEGAEANILISPKNVWIKQMQQKGLIDVYSRTNIARNRLVLAGSQFMPIPPALHAKSNINEITDQPDDFMFALGDPEYTPEGGLGLEILNHYDLLGLMEPHYHFFRDIYQMIGAISDDNAVGVLLRTDTVLFPNIKTLQLFSPETHPPITYQAVVIAGENMEEGREFITYLQSDHAKNVFASFGFDAVF